MVEFFTPQEVFCTCRSLCLSNYHINQSWPNILPWSYAYSYNHKQTVYSFVSLINLFKVHHQSEFLTTLPWRPPLSAGDVIVYLGQEMRWFTLNRRCNGLPGAGNVVQCLILSRRSNSLPWAADTMVYLEQEMQWFIFICSAYNVYKHTVNII